MILRAAVLTWDEELIANDGEGHEHDQHPKNVKCVGALEQLVKFPQIAIAAVICAVVRLTLLNLRVFWNLCQA